MLVDYRDEGGREGRIDRDSKRDDGGEKIGKSFQVPAAPSNFKLSA